MDDMDRVEAIAEDHAELDEILEAEAQEEETEREDAVAEEIPDETAKLKRQLAEANDKYLRLMAEYDNFRKRSAREKDEIYPNATCVTLGKFLPVLDNFERAMEFDSGTGEFAKGIEMIYQSFKELLESFGVEAFGQVGDDFDPNLYNCVMHVDDEQFGKNAVSMVMQKGYKLGDRVIRHAMVQVAN